MMAGFTVEECAKVSHHKTAATIEKNYNPGIRTSKRSNMAAAIVKAPSLKRGNAFITVDQALPKKISKAMVEFADPMDMLPDQRLLWEMKIYKENFKRKEIAE